MLQIWGRPYSSNVIPVIWTANELGLDYELHLAGGQFGKLDSDEYAQINPNRLIPAIRDGDFTLWESHAIVRYLATKYGMGHLCPMDVQRRARADQWMEWSATTAFSPVIWLFFSMVRTEPDQRDMAKVSALRDDAVKVLRLLDAHLAHHTYVTGDDFSMGDIPLGCVAYRYFNVQVDRPDLPNLARWYDLLCQRTAYQDHVMRFFGTNPTQWHELETASASEGIL